MMEAIIFTVCFWVALKTILFGMDVAQEMRKNQWLRRKS